MNSRTPVPLASLFGDPIPDAFARLTVSGLCLDSRRVQAGDAFVALQGDNQNGLAFIEQAKLAGAVVAIVDAQSQLPEVDFDLPVLAIEQLALKLPAMARSFYANPGAQLQLLGVTGTNGKTSCAWFYAHWVAQLQEACGMLGTLGYGVATQAGANFEATGFTTPDVFSLQRILRELVDAGCKRAAMEVSSHALAQGRVAELGFDTAIFTNLSRDHLDYHKDMRSYALAKRKLFETPGLQRAVINIDDAAGRELVATLPKGVVAISYSLKQQSADVFARDIEIGIDGITATVVTPAGQGQLHCKFPGLFNLANMLAVLAALQAEGFALSALLDCASDLPYVPGRMQRVALPDAVDRLPDFAVFIDYAHTPDALENALAALKPQVDGLLRLVFGAGGDRDSGKRAVMGEVAARLADDIVITSDNPRSESPARIADDISTGMPSGANVVVELDRERAIKLAIDRAAKGDVVLVAGKGHERFQEQDGRKHPFDDYAVAQRALLARCAA